MDEPEVAQIVGQIRALVETHYLYPDVAATVSRVLAEGLAEGRYPAEEPSLAAAVTTDLQSAVPPWQRTDLLRGRAFDGLLGLCRSQHGLLATS